MIATLLLMLALQDTPKSSTDLARGKKLFESQCALCHGQTGEGGRGPNLAVAKLRRAPDPLSMYILIRSGIDGTEMDAVWQMSDPEVKDVVAYVLSFGKVAQQQLPGDAANGKQLFAAQGCANCHIVSGVGTALGPELTSVGAQRNAAHLREHLTDPGKSVAPAFLMVRATMRDGKKLSGIRLSEDTFTVQLRDASGKIHSLRKFDLASYAKAPNESLMPNFRSLSSTQLDDLVAYLASLRGMP